MKERTLKDHKAKRATMYVARDVHKLLASSSGDGDAEELPSVSEHHTAAKQLLEAMELGLQLSSEVLLRLKRQDNLAGAVSD